MKFQAFFLSFALLGPMGAAAASSCNDSGKIYKICSDQEAAYRGKFGDAKDQNKMLVVVIGAEWCPWCLSLHKMLKDT